MRQAKARIALFLLIGISAVTAQNFADLGPSAIVINLDRGGFDDAFTSVEDGVVWDFYGNGRELQLAWTNPKRNIGFLVLPRKLDAQFGEPDPHGKVIKSCQDLFSNLTWQPLSDAEQDKLRAEYAADDAAGRPYQPFNYRVNGWRALAEFDQVQQGGNNDGKISAEDKVFPLLKVCTFRPPDTTIGSNCHTLQELGIKSISLKYAESHSTDKYGNRMHYVSTIEMADPKASAPFIYDVFFK